MEAFTFYYPWPLHYMMHTAIIITSLITKWSNYGLAKKRERSKPRTTKLFTTISMEWSFAMLIWTMDNITPSILKCLKWFAFMSDWFQTSVSYIRLDRLVDRWLNFSTLNVLYIKCILNCLREVRIGFLPAWCPLEYQPLQLCTQANFPVEMTVHKCKDLPFKNLLMADAQRFYTPIMKIQNIISILLCCSNSSSVEVMVSLILHCQNSSQWYAWSTLCPFPHFRP